MTPIQKAYKKQINRIKRLIRTYEKRGFVINYDLPALKRPNRRSIEKLKRINANDILEKSAYTLDTGDIVSGYEARFILRQRAGRKGARTKRLERAKQNIEIYTRVDLIESIRNRLMDISERSWAISDRGAVPYDFDSAVFPLISLMNDAEGELGTDAYEAYLKDNEYPIISELDKIREEKYLDQLQASFVSLANLLRPTGATTETMTTMSELSDLYNLI